MARRRVYNAERLSGGSSWIYLQVFDESQLTMAFTFYLVNGKPHYYVSNFCCNVLADLNLELSRFQSFVIKVLSKNDFRSPELDNMSLSELF